MSLLIFNFQMNELCLIIARDPRLHIYFSIVPHISSQLTLFVTLPPCQTMPLETSVMYAYCSTGELFCFFTVSYPCISTQTTKFDELMFSLVQFTPTVGHSLYFITHVYYNVKNPNLLGGGKYMSLLIFNLEMNKGCL